MNNEKIITLKGADRVRKRPAVIFGHTGVDGATKAIVDVIKIFTTEALVNGNGKFSVTVNSDNSIAILSRDRGIVIDETETDGKPNWHDVFCELYAYSSEFNVPTECKGNMFGEFEKPYPRYTPDYDDWFVICCAQYVSEFMHVKSVRDGVCKRLEFSKGVNVGGVKSSPTDEQTGSFIHFKIDKEVFGTDEISVERICDYLKLCALTVDGLECKLTANGNTETFTYSNGISGYVSDFAGDNAVTPVFTTKIEASGKERYNTREYNASVKVAVCFAKNRSLIKCIHNYYALSEGGTHLETALSRITSAISCPCEFENIKDSIVLVIETKCTHRFSNWITGARNSIKNRMITDMVYDAFGSDFRYFVSKNEDAISKLLK